MGMIDRMIGVGDSLSAASAAATNVAEVFTQNQTRRMELDEEAYARALAQHGAEFETVRPGWFDSFVNGLNRLPRPLLTLGTMGLFVYAMAEPIGFTARMEGLALVPDPLWWLMGAIVSFYFGAREAHYFRARVWPRGKVKQTAVEATDRGVVKTEVSAWKPEPADVGAVDGSAAPSPAPVPTATPAPVGVGPESFADNPALADWAARR